MAGTTEFLHMRNHSLSSYLDRYRFVSLGSLETISTPLETDPNKPTYMENLNKLESQWYVGMMKLQNGNSIKIWNSLVFERLVTMYGASTRCTNFLHRYWIECRRRLRLQRWQDLMLWCMQNSPENALALLILTMKVRYWRPPRYMAQDCLTLLARHFLKGPTEPNPRVLDMLWKVLFSLVNDVPHLRSHFWSVSQDVVHLLLKNGDRQQALALYETLVWNQAHLTANTMLHFIETFADMGKVNLCMTLLRRIAGEFPITFQTGQQVQSGCVRLLRTQWDAKEPYPIQSSILSQMLELGIRPNRIFYNAILLTMIEGRDFDTAWRTYDMAKQSDQFWNNSITYSILVKGAKLSGDFLLLENILRELEDSPALIDKQLICNILSAIKLLYPADAFSQMIALYEKHLDIRPLEELGIYTPSSGVTPGPKSPAVDGIWPLPIILGQIIIARNELHNLNDELIQRYTVYQDLVHQQHPLIAPLASNDYVSNSFLMAFGKNPETLPYCTLVLKHMLSPSAATSSIPRATPTVQTWNILANAFIRHGQKLAAEKVLNMMRERGLDPDIVTWNTLISGYARLHDVGDVVGSMRRMEAAGFEPDSWTLKGLRRLHDRKKLLDILRARLSESQ